jgi:glycosyltransferase involved in cell wall biosynthesis
MSTKTLNTLPPPPASKTGWPWTEATPPLPPTMPDGRPWPRISIVTPSYNQGRFIEETIRSVLLQGYPNLEYIIIDGGSSDESVEIIRKYESWLTYWVSEPDRGQSHAINKGWNIATGEIRNWLCSDDILLTGVLEEIAHAYSYEKKMIVGNTVFIDVTKESEFVMRPRLSSNYCEIYVDFQIAQPSAFFCNMHPFVRDDLHYVMDWELQWRTLRNIPDKTLSFHDRIWAKSIIHSASKSAGDGDWKKISEIVKLQRELVMLLPWYRLWFAVLRWLRRRQIIDYYSRAYEKRSLRTIVMSLKQKPLVLTTRFFWGAVRRTVLSKALFRYP